MKQTQSKIKKWISQILIAFILIPVSSHSTTIYESDFQGIGIRPNGMGNAYTGFAEGAGALYFNPAGLASKSTGAVHEDFDLSKDVYSENKSSTFFFSPFGYSSFSQVNRDGSALNISTYGYGKKGSNGVDWGVNYKTIAESDASGNTILSGWSADLGLKVNITKFMSFGTMIRDFIKEDLDIPTTFRSGLSFYTPNKSFVFSTDLVQKRTGNTSDIATHLGLELLLSDGLKLRTGIFGNNYSLGLNLLLPFMNIEYGYISSYDSSADSRYMLGFNIGQTQKAPPNRRQYSLFRPSSYAEFSIGSSLTSGKSEVSLLGGTKIGTNDLLANIRQANLDPTCEGYIIRIGHLSSSLSSIGLIQDIRSELEKAKLKGKTIVTYLDSWAMLPEYYLASIGSKIVMPELGTLSHLGVKVEINKTKEFLKNFGINHDIITSGKFKSQLRPNSSDITEEGRNQLQRVVDDLFENVIADIKKERNLNWNDTKSLFDGRLITASQAKQKGLIDEFGYWNQAKDVALKIKKATSIEHLANFKFTPGPRTLFSPNNKIAVVEIDGFIGQGINSTNFIFGGKSTGSDEIEAILSSIEKNPSIKGVILRINSPGGSNVAAEQIYQAIELVKKTGKPIYSSMGSMATSGGYYIAVNSDKILANPGTLTGSIGTISSFSNIVELEKMLAIKSDSIKTGQYMDMMSSHSKLSTEEINMIQTIQEEAYDIFVDHVASNRNFSKEETDKVSQGQLFTGLQAKNLNLIDDIGNLYDTVDSITEATNIQGEPELIYFRKDTSPLSSASQFFGIPSSFFSLINLI
ncbi:signal peptide peptidase SppA [bacterium]|jgi:protease IV|nr:signal peptide peptidase SppA [bacterium]